MNPRILINFLKSKTGTLLVFFTLIFIAVFVVWKTRKPVLPKEAAPPKQLLTQSIETVPGNMVPFKVPLAAEPVPTPTPSPTPVPAEKKQTLAPISLYAANPKSIPEPLSAEYAPFGRLIPCELVVTVDSSAIETPVIGLVTADIWHDKRLIIPAGTEVHGRASLNRARERIAAQGAWTLVWQSGEELVLSGVALDREEKDDGWGLTDGSAGIRGQVIKTDDLTELKLFAATFLSAGANAFQDTQSTIYGTRPDATAKNAALSGVSAVLNSYAAQMLQAIRLDGMFVRVPAGKQFYLYVTETLDRQKATVGGSQTAGQPLKASTPIRPASVPPAIPHQTLEN